MTVPFALFFILTVGAAFASNRDIFSPGKVFLFSFLAFHVGAFFTPTSLNVWLLAFLLLVVGMLAVLFEASTGVRSRAALLPRDASCDVLDRPSHAFFLWLVSLPALLAQLYMIQLFGGVEGYINSLALRVVEWRGLGWAKTVIALMAPINLVYFAVGLTGRRSRTWWALYGLHLFFLLLMGALSGSRSGLLNIFAMQLILYHYLKRQIKLRQAVTMASVLVLLALVLGVVREGIKVDDGEIMTGLDASDRAVNVATFYYGIEPLEILVNSERMPLAYGSTFLSLFTNAIPRDLWPDKPDSGGVFFTKAYTDDAWDGASNLTPTFMGEWIINFGWVAGLAGFLLAYPLMLRAVIGLYRRTLHEIQAKPSELAAIDLVIYVHIMWSVVALMTGETTNVLLNLMLTQLLPLALIRRFICSRARP